MYALAVLTLAVADALVGAYDVVAAARFLL